MSILLHNTVIISVNIKVHNRQHLKSERKLEAKSFTKFIRDRPRKAVRPLVMFWFHVEAQGGRRVGTYWRKR